VYLVAFAALITLLGLIPTKDKGSYTVSVCVIATQPNLGGLEMMRRYKEWREEQPFGERNKRAVFLGMSANATVEDQDEGLAIGLHIFATKPVQPDCLSALLDARRSYLEVNEVLDAFQRSRYDRDCVSQRASSLVQTVRVIGCSCPTSM